MSDKQLLAEVERIKAGKVGVGFNVEHKAAVLNMLDVEIKKRHNTIKLVDVPAKKEEPKK